MSKIFAGAFTKTALLVSAMALTACAAEVMEGQVDDADSEELADEELTLERTELALGADPKCPTEEQVVAGTPTEQLVGNPHPATSTTSIDLPIAGRLEVGVACTYAEFYIANERGEKVWTHKCGFLLAHGLMWYDVKNLPAGKYTLVAHARSNLLQGEGDGYLQVIGVTCQR